MPKIITNYIPRYDSEVNDNMPAREDVLDEYKCWKGFRFIKPSWRTE